MSKTVIPDDLDVSEPVLDPTTGDRGYSETEREVVQAPRRTTRKPTSYKIPEGEDPAKWYREKGKAPLTHRYRVTARKGGQAAYVHECHAVDESEAISFCAVSANIKPAVQHTYSFTVVRL